MKSGKPTRLKSSNFIRPKTSPSSKSYRKWRIGLGSKDRVLTKIWLAKKHSITKDSPRKAQYQRKFSDWGIRKNSMAKEWQFIANRVRKREAQQRRSRVEVRGEAISSVRLRKEIARYGYQTTLEQLNSGIEIY